MSRLVSRSDVVRLGKRGSYRLGGPGPSGTGQPAPPRPFRPSFARPAHAGPLSAWVLACLAGVTVIAAGAALGLWFVPFVVGLTAGVVMRWGGWRFRVTGPAMIVLATAGWGLALWIPALTGLPVGAAAGTISALAGFPAVAGITVGVTLGVAVLQILAGLWLGRAIAPRPARD